MKGIGWNLAERGRGLTAGSSCSIVFHPSINEWNNRREVQLEIKDFVHGAPRVPAMDRRPTASAIPID